MNYQHELMLTPAERDMKQLTASAPEGADEAKVAFNTRMMATTVIYHLLLADQFLGFSTSSGAKSTWPSSLRYGFSSRSIWLDLYGFATGRESILSSFSMALMIYPSMLHVRQDAIPRP